MSERKSEREEMSEPVNPNLNEWGRSASWRITDEVRDLMATIAPKLRGDERFDFPHSGRTGTVGGLAMAMVFYFAEMIETRGQGAFRRRMAAIWPQVVKSVNDEIARKKAEANQGGEGESQAMTQRKSRKAR
ncbi:MAG TPA: hypothetical protein VGR89_01735 [Puia sp.]|nr:hypothetical protein [Puia sp.]